MQHLHSWKTHAYESGKMRYGLPGFCLVTWRLPVGLLRVSTRCTCFTLGPTRRSSFARSSLSLKLGGWTPNSHDVFCVFQTETTNSAAAAWSTQLVDTSTSARVIWDAIVLLCDTLYVSNGNLVYLRGSYVWKQFLMSKGEYSAVIKGPWPRQSKWCPVRLLLVYHGRLGFYLLSLLKKNRVF